jgi:hypothetical protein
MPRHHSHHGIALGPGSPLLTAAGARRTLQATEEDMGIALMSLLVGPAWPGQARQLGDGMTDKYPELMLLYHIPNGGVRSKRTASRLKAAGALRALPDYCLPVSRGPFLSLYLELKRPGEQPRADQWAMMGALQVEGHCVQWCDRLDQALAVVLGYLDLAPRGVSMHPIASDLVAKELVSQRAVLTTVLAGRTP